MFDFDEFGPCEEEAWPNEEDLGPNRLQVVVYHPIEELDVRVVLPKRAKFKHVKKALAKRFKRDEIAERGQLVDKVNGVYVAYKDRDPIGDVRRLLLINAELQAAGGADRIVTGLIDKEVSEDESQWCTVEYIGGSTRKPSSSSKKPSEPSQTARDGRGAPRRQGHGAPHVVDIGLPGSSWAPLEVGGPRKPHGLLKQAREPSGPMLTKSQAMQLQEELYEAFRAPEFQDELQNLLWRAEESGVPHTELVWARQELFWAVQREVLPRYGFEEDNKDTVYQMMAAMGPFIKDPDFIELAEKVNAVVGVDNKSERWGSIQKACQQFDFVDGGRSPKRS